MRRHAIVLTGTVALSMAGIMSSTTARAFESFFLDQQKAYSESRVARHSPQPAVASVEPASVQPAAPAYSPAQPGVGDQPGADSRPLASAIPREVVAYDGAYPAGTIVVSTDERRLYFVLPDHQAVKYGVGVGRPGFEWAGAKTVTMKKEWPDWTPPPEMIKRRPDLPKHMEGGIENPLGARAMYLGGTMYRIHGSNEPDSIGQAVSSGCIRMTNDDVVDLYQRVKVGTKAFVQR